MKYRNGLMLLIAVIIFGCNNAANTDKVADTLKATNSEEVASDHHEEQEAHVGELALNNGAKWQTDESTRSHAGKLEAQLADFYKKEPVGLAAYQALATDMQKELDGLVSDCKMKGPDHDALHTWLLPVLNDVSTLKKMSTAEEAKQATAKLDSDVRKFKQYFN